MLHVELEVHRVAAVSERLIVQSPGQPAALRSRPDGHEERAVLAAGVRVQLVERPDGLVL
jgi:hypothetical protein